MRIAYTYSERKAALRDISLRRRREPTVSFSTSPGCLSWRADPCACGIYTSSTLKGPGKIQDYPSHTRSTLSYMHEGRA